MHQKFSDSKIFTHLYLHHSVHSKQCLAISCQYLGNHISRKPYLKENISLGNHIFRKPYLQKTKSPGNHISRKPYLQETLSLGYHISRKPYLQETISLGNHISRKPYLQEIISPGNHISRQPYLQETLSLGNHISRLPYLSYSFNPKCLKSFLSVKRDRHPYEIFFSNFVVYNNVIVNNNVKMSFRQTKVSYFERLSHSHSFSLVAFLILLSTRN